MAKIWLTKTALWLIRKFMKDGPNHIATKPGAIGGTTDWYVNGKFVGSLSDNEENINYFPFAMPHDWIEELFELQTE